MDKCKDFISTKKNLAGHKKQIEEYIYGFKEKYIHQQILRDKMKMKKTIFFALLLIMMVGAVSASDNMTDDAVELDESNGEAISQIETSDEISTQDTEPLEQTNEDTLSAARTYDIYDYNTLHSVLTSDTYDQLTLNIKSNIKLAGNTAVSTSISKLTINGNGKTVDGNGQYQFMYLQSTALTLKNLKFVNCRSQFGGAIENDADYMSITGCTFTNCQSYHAVTSGIIWINGYTMKMYGGAIYTEGNHVTISNNVFENNRATTGSPSYQDQIIRGGAVYNYGDYATITNNKFIGNSANYNKITCRGGAIYNYGDNVRISNNEFSGNDADYGGAIYNAGYTSIISNNKFKDNYADERGSAIYNTGNTVTIDSNNFKANMNYGSADAVIVNSESDAQIYSNRIVSTGSYSKGTIVNYDGSSVIIKNNVFDDRRDTKIAVPSVAEYGGYLVITLKDDNGNPISGAKVSVKLKGTKTYTTNKNGQIKVPTTGLALKKYAVKIKFTGNKKYLAASASKKVKIKKGGLKIVAKSKTFKKSATKKYKVTIKNKAGKAIKKAKVTLKVKGKTYKATTNKKGKATFTLKITKKGKFKGKIKAKAGKYYKTTGKKVKITIK